MRSTCFGFCLAALLALPPAGAAALGAKASKVANPEALYAEKLAKRLEKLDGQLHRGEWAAAEAEARLVIKDALLRNVGGTFDAVARLALAEAGEGRTEDALWYWGIAQNLDQDVRSEFDLRSFGAPGELLASHALRGRDEAPAGLDIRRPGDGGPPFSPPRVGETKSVEVPRVWGAIPKGIELQVVVDAQGRPAQPVVTHSTSQAFTYVLLEALRDWRFEPARAGEAPVAAFYEIKLPVRRPLAGIADLSGSPLVGPEAALRAGQYPEAAKQVGKAWDSSLENTVPSRPFLGIALALKALAQAGQGEEDGAICRWQAAQTLEPRLYGADLSAYGAAGTLLEGHPWGERYGGTKTIAKKGEPGESVQKPEILKRRPPRYPEYARSQGAQGSVVVQSVLTKTGVPRNLILLTPDALPGLEANALDALCDWRFKPAIYQGEPVPVYYSLTVHFELRR
jgi:TonB family protein